MFFLKPIYLAMGQDPKVVAYAVEYVHILTPSMFLFSMQRCLTFYNFGMRVMWISFAGMFSGCLSHILLMLLLYNGLGWGFSAICWAT